YRVETLDRLHRLPNATWIRGNGERWLREPPADRPEVVETYERHRDQVSADVVDWLYNLPPQAELDGVLYVHGSPLGDDDSFAAEPQEGEERLLAGVGGRTIVFGHSHLQFRRPGPDGTDLVNPGSVGMPLDGDTRAAWATWDGDFTFRRTAYDVEPAAAAYRSMGGDFGEFAARRIENGSHYCPIQPYMPASGPRSRGARAHPRSCQGCQPWPRPSAASGLVLATQKLGGITGRGTDARPAVRRARQPARPRGRPRRCEAGGRRRVAARRRLLRLRSVAGRDAGAAARAGEHDVDPRQRRALARGSSAGPAGGDARVHPRCAGFLDRAAAGRRHRLAERA